MAVFLKANIASLSSSLFDYLITIILVTFFKVDAFVASIIGNVCGGVLNFTIGRNWVFQAKEARVRNQAVKYGLVWVGSLFLNAGGMYYLLKIVGLHYLVSKVIVSLLVGVAYNYVLQKKFVFK